MKISLGKFKDGVSLVFQSFKDVLRVFQKQFIFSKCFKAVSKKLGGVLGRLYECFRVFSWKFHWCFKRIISDFSFTLKSRAWQGLD